MGDRWQNRASCRGADPNIFHPEIERGDSSDSAYVQARIFCRDCPVTMECLEYCLEYEDRVGRRNGMFGNMTPRERGIWVRRNGR